MQRDAFVRGMNDPDLKFSKNERDEIMGHMLDDRTWRAHATKTMEECAELQVELSKHICDKGDRMHLLEEMADVYISLCLMQAVLDISADEINKAIDVKLKRNEFRHQSRKEQKRKDELGNRIF